MQKTIDLTGKLGIGEKKRIIADKGVELEVDDSAPTVLRVLDIMKGGGGLEQVMEICGLFFGEKGMERLKALKVPSASYNTLADAAIELVMGGGDEGNAETPATA